MADATTVRTRGAIAAIAAAGSDNLVAAAAKTYYASGSKAYDGQGATKRKDLGSALDALSASSPISRGQLRAALRKGQGIKVLMSLLVSTAHGGAAVGAKMPRHRCFTCLGQGAYCPDCPRGPLAGGARRAAGAAAAASASAGSPTHSYSRSWLRFHLLNRATGLPSLCAETPHYVGGMTALRIRPLCLCDEG
jgi:hypothetical protein